MIISMLALIRISWRKLQSAMLTPMITEVVVQMCKWLHRETAVSTYSRDVDGFGPLWSSTASFIPGNTRYKHSSSNNEQQTGRLFSPPPQ